MTKKGLNKSKYTERILKLDELLRKKKTGSATQLSKLLGTSRRQVYNYFERLGQLGRDIRFNEKEGSFEYMKDSWFDD